MSLNWADDSDDDCYVPPDQESSSGLALITGLVTPQPSLTSQPSLQAQTLSVNASASSVSSQSRTVLTPNTRSATLADQPTSASRPAHNNNHQCYFISNFASSAIIKAQLQNSAPIPQHLVKIDQLPQNILNVANPVTGSSFYRFTYNNRQEVAQLYKFYINRGESLNFHILFDNAQLEQFCKSPNGANADESNSNSRVGTPRTSSNHLSIPSTPNNSTQRFTNKRTTADGPEQQSALFTHPKLLSNKSTPSQQPFEANPDGKFATKTIPIIIKDGDEYLSKSALSADQTIRSREEILAEREQRERESQRKLQDPSVLDDNLVTSLRGGFGTAQTDDKKHQQYERKHQHQHQHQNNNNNNNNNNHGQIPNRQNRRQDGGNNRNADENSNTTHATPIKAHSRPHGHQNNRNTPKIVSATPNHRGVNTRVPGHNWDSSDDENNHIIPIGAVVDTGSPSTPSRGQTSYGRGGRSATSSRAIPQQDNDNNNQTGGKNQSTLGDSTNATTSNNKFSRSNSQHQQKDKDESNAPLSENSTIIASTASHDNHKPPHNHRNKDSRPSTTHNTPSSTRDTSPDGSSANPRSSFNNRRNNGNDGHLDTPARENEKAVRIDESANKHSKAGERTPRLQKTNSKPSNTTSPENASGKSHENRRSSSKNNTDHVEPDPGLRALAVMLQEDEAKMKKKDQQPQPQPQANKRKSNNDLSTNSFAGLFEDDDHEVHNS